jgi:4,5-DOPA dioxygenase extradiol
MNRRQVIKILSTTLAASSFAALFWRKSMQTPRMPTLFLGHGSPMNALEQNDFTRSLVKLATELPKPKAILCISAHWMTSGTWVTHMKKPKTIHDFYGFPQELFNVQYAAPGSPELAELVASTISQPKIFSDEEKWGLDHGTWSVLRHMHPKADIPIIQLSLDMTKPIEFHLALGKQLSPLRDLGILIVGSGNVVHNLRMISWNENANPHPWATEFDQWIKEKINARDFNAVVFEATKSQAGQLSIPTPDHYYPLLYILGASTPSDPIEYVYEGIQNAAISMRSIRFG